MNVLESKPWQRGWVIGLALLSLLVPVAAGYLRTEPLVPFADPARLSYYRQTVVALVVGLACAAGAFAGIRTVPAAGGRRLSVALASLGVLISVYLLWALIGTCGLGVLGGACNPFWG